MWSELKFWFDGILVRNIIENKSSTIIFFSWLIFEFRCRQRQKSLFPHVLIFPLCSFSIILDTFQVVNGLHRTKNQLLLKVEIKPR